MQFFFSAICLLTSLSNSVPAQNAAKTTQGRKINGISFSADKKTILKTFGKPIKQFAPHAECGFLSDEQGEIFYTLRYSQLDWTGSNKAGYIMENLFILPGSRYQITYKGKSLSSLTTIKEFMDVTGIHSSEVATGVANPADLIKLFKDPNLKTTFIDLTYKGSDDKYISYFFKGRLCKIEYWLPC